MSTLRILACQLHIPPTTSVNATTQHLASSAKKADRWLAENPADILLLPELSTLDYANDTFAALDELAEDDKGRSFETWRRLAIKHNCWVLYGYARRHRISATETRYSIATGVMNPRGELYGVYDKTHLAQFGASEEKDYFSVSGKQLLVFECNDFKLAPIICYDIRFPELSRALVLQHGVDVILHTGAYARDASFDSWHAFVKTRAMENQVFVVSLNRAGQSFGKSVFMPPLVNEQPVDEPLVNEQEVDKSRLSTRFAEHKEQCLLLTLDKQTLNQAREEFHFLDDRLASYDLPV